MKRAIAMRACASSDKEGRSARRESLDAVNGPAGSGSTHVFEELKGPGGRSIFARDEVHGAGEH